MCPVERAYAPKRGMKTIPRDDVHGDGKQPLERGPSTPGPGHKLISTFTRTRVQYRHSHVWTFCQTNAETRCLTSLKLARREALNHRFSLRYVHRRGFEFVGCIFSLSWKFIPQNTTKLSESSSRQTRPPRTTPVVNEHLGNLHNRSRPTINRTPRTRRTVPVGRKVERRGKNNISTISGKFNGEMKAKMKMKKKTQKYTKTQINVMNWKCSILG